MLEKLSLHYSYLRTSFNQVMCSISDFGCVHLLSQCPWVPSFCCRCQSLVMRSWSWTQTATTSSGLMAHLFMVRTFIVRSTHPRVQVHGISPCSVNTWLLVAGTCPVNSSYKRNFQGTCLVFKLVWICLAGHKKQIWSLQSSNSFDEHNCKFCFADSYPASRDPCNLPEKKNREGPFLFLIFLGRSKDLCLQGSWQQWYTVIV